MVVAAVGAQSVNRSLLTLKTEDNPSDPMDGARGPFSPDFAGGGLDYAVEEVFVSVTDMCSAMGVGC